jgi:hypothetical protein
MCGSAPKPPPVQPPPSQPPPIVTSTPEVKTGGDPTDINKRKKVASKNLRVPLGTSKVSSSGLGS